MNFGLSKEEEAFRKEVEDFIKENMREEIKAGALLNYMDNPAKIEFGKKMAKKGWLGMSWPEEYGGGGSKMLLAEYLLNRELMYACLPIIGRNVLTIGQTIMHHGSEKLKKEILPKILRNEIQWGIAYTEPEAGSDLANLQTRAVQEGDWFILNGQKRFCSGGHVGDYYLLAARTDPEAPKHKGISLFVVDAHQPGIIVTPLITANGERTNEVFLDNVRVHKDYLIGELNQGWTYLTEALAHERYHMLASVTIKGRFERFIEWLKNVEVDGWRPKDDPEIRRRVAKMACRMEIADMLMVRCITTINKPGYVPVVEGAMNRYWGGMIGLDLDDMVLEIMGPFGYLYKGSKYAPMDGEMAQAYLADGISRVAASGVDVSRNVIARRGLGMR